MGSASQDINFRIQNEFSLLKTYFNLEIIKAMFDQKTFGTKV